MVVPQTLACCFHHFNQQVFIQTGSICQHVFCIILQCLSYRNQMMDSKHKTVLKRKKSTPPAFSRAVLIIDAKWACKNDIKTPKSHKKKRILHQSHVLVVSLPLRLPCSFWDIYTVKLSCFSLLTTVLVWDSKVFLVADDNMVCWLPGNLAACCSLTPFFSYGL